MTDCKLPILNDKEVQESITNIETWLNTYSQSVLHRHICAEDLAVAIPGECLFLELLQENEEAHREMEKGILVYTDAREEQYLWLKRDWQPLDRILKITSSKNGWIQTQSLGERLLVLVLTQLDYRAREAEGEVPYGCCPPTDPTYLLWAHHTLAGMASIKRKGSSIWGGEEVYACATLDTLYVRPSHRRQGHTLTLLSTLAATLPPGEHLGLSHPVSLSMCKVLLKFIQVCPELRDTLWTLDEDGEVSGTVMLMLGSLMMRGALYPQPATTQQQSCGGATTSPPATVPQQTLLINTTTSSPLQPVPYTTTSPTVLSSVGGATITTTAAVKVTAAPMCTLYNNNNNNEANTGDKEEPCDTS